MVRVTQLPPQRRTRALRPAPPTRPGTAAGPAHEPAMLDRRAGPMTADEQQMLAFGRALMTDPSLLLLGEPSTGLAPGIVASLFDALRELIAAGGMSVVLVEQNAGLALEVVERAYVLRQGRIVLQGTAEEMRGGNLVDAYLGA